MIHEIEKMVRWTYVFCMGKGKPVGIRYSHLCCDADKETDVIG